MPCSVRKRKAIAYSDGETTTDWVPMNKQIPPGCEHLDIRFTLTSRVGVDNLKDDYTKGNVPADKYINGLAFAVKFPNQEEACPKTAKDFDTMIKVPRVYDVSVVNASVARCRRELYTVGKVADYVRRATLDSAQMKEDGYEFSTLGTDTTGDTVQKLAWQRQMQNNLGRDYVLVVAQKDVYPAFLKAIRHHCGYIMAAHEFTLTRAGWYAACQDVQPIFSSYYKWVVDGTQSAGMTYNNDGTGKPGQTGYTSVDQVEIGHYEFHEFNKRYDNFEVTPNDVYSDGAIIGVVGIHHVADGQVNHLFNDSFFHLILYYKLETVKAGVIYLQNIKEFQDLTYFGRQRNVFTDDGADLTNVSHADRLTKKGYYEVAVYGNEGTFYPIDTLNVTESMGAATGDVYSESASFATRTPGYPKNV